MAELSTSEKERYARQLIIPGWGEPTQKRLKASKVFIAGAGGLGSPASLYLAAAGVGTLRICDFDKPELSNLNRQLLHDESRLEVNKAESARMTLARVNPHTVVEALTEEIDDESVCRLVGDSDLILDCMDNFPTRFLLNAISVKHGIPMIHGSIWGFEGRVTFLHPPKTPCLACLFPEAPPKEVFPVVGATPGITGVIQAMEAIKYLAGTGSLLEGRLLCCDYLDMSFRTFQIRRDPRCPVCGAALT